MRFPIGVIISLHDFADLFDIHSCSVIRNGEGKIFMIQRNIYINHRRNGKSIAAAYFKSVFE